jgi:hypothetical protein
MSFYQCGSRAPLNWTYPTDEPDGPHSIACAQMKIALEIASVFWLQNNDYLFGCIRG